MRLLTQCIVYLSTLLLVLSANENQLPAAEIDFNRDVRPILSDLCFQCHGPDKSQRKADLRLDLEEGLFGTKAEPGVVIQGKTAESELFSRLTSTDPDEQMPPAKSGKKITPAQVAIIKQWINEGAKWQKHWSFIPPRRPQVPEVKQTKWVRNPIDAFVLRHLEAKKISPSVEAEKSTLLRRLSLDLTGLPATLAEQEQFFKDNSPTAYEKVVERLLKSPHYGERMAMEWLDAARFADTSGYQTDGERHMWRWREWVINAFNNNMPFDQFTVEQLAGDLLPKPTLNQQIATGFNRNHRSNSEGGIIFDEYLLEYAVDRVETTGTVWLGLTIGCARCHEHKYDPVSQKEFYQLIAFFNNIPERGRAIKYGNAAPFVKAPTQAQQEKLVELDQNIELQEKFLQQKKPFLKQWQTGWEQRYEAGNFLRPFPEKHLGYRVTFNGKLELEQISKLQDDFYANKDNAATMATGVKQEKETAKPQYANGLFNQALKLPGDLFYGTAKKLQLNDKSPFSISFWVKPLQQQGTMLASLTQDRDESGFRIFLDDGKLKIYMGSRWGDDAIILHGTEKIKLNRWSQIAVTYAGNSQAADFKLYVNGDEQKLDIKLNMLTGGFAFPAPLQFGTYLQDYFQGLIDDLKIYHANLSPDDAAILTVTQTISQILLMPKSKRSKGQQLKISHYHMLFIAPKKFRSAYTGLISQREHREKYYRKLPTSMVMQDRKQQKQTFVLMRGEYDKPGEKVSAGIPESLGALPEGLPKNRLGLARWLVDSSNPLTARVIVNRYWQFYFGHGLVKTTEDFGSQGDWPTHPDLLDWLATEFVRTGWNVKALQKLIVSSATYRQSSHLSSTLKLTDPENRLLARASRLRLPAEIIRDQALFTSGLLRTKLGGPSVKPYQPKGVWKEIASQAYKPDKGDDLYRRSMYTFWKRTVPPPAMSTFDAPSRETCIVKRSRTNTPLQALALLNDVTYVEASRKLAERMLKQTDDPASRIRFAFQVMLARTPQERELAVLTTGYERYLSRFQKQPAAAKKLLAVGSSPRNKKLNMAEHAACTIIASLILNLDETINRE